MRLGWILSFGVIVASALPVAPAAAQDRPRRLAVLVLGSGGLEAETAEGLTEVLIAALVARGGVEVVGKVEFQAQLGTDETESQNCLASAPCIGRVGVQLQVDEVVAGTVGPRRGGGYTLSLSRIDVATTEVEGRIFEQVEGDQQALVAAIQRAAEEVYEEPERPGRLRVTANAERAEVYVDDERMGSTPLTLSDLPPGTYQVRVERRGYEAWSGEVEIRAGETAEVEAELEEGDEPVVSDGSSASGLAIALTVAGGALTIGGGVVGYLFATSSQEDPESSTQARAAKELDDREGEALIANIAFAAGGAALLFTTYMLVFQSDAVFGGAGEERAQVAVVPVADGGAMATARVTW